MKPEKKSVPLVVVKRLPRYYRYFGDLLRQGITRISSKELGARMSVTASQIRQDFNFFGGFGQQGYGYNVEKLHQEIGKILGLAHVYKTIIIGAGDLGHTLAKYDNFARRGFEICALFDKNPDLIGTSINNIPILPMAELESCCQENEVEIAILTLPNTAVEQIVPKLVEANIKGIWNFSYMDINVPPEIAVENVHLIDGLMTLAYKISEKKS